MSLHSLLYARLYASGWWCERHTPNRQAGRAEANPPPGPGWPIHRQPPPEPAVPSIDEHEDPT